jgi:hypothetical protein
VRGLLASVVVCVALGALDAAGAPAKYRSLAIIGPAPGETVYDGDVAVVVDLSPPLHVEDGDRIALLVDGRSVASTGRTAFELAGIGRGAHQLQAQVTARGGEALIASPPVTFYVRRASPDAPAGAR